MAFRVKTPRYFALAAIVTAAIPGLGTAGAVNEYRIIAPDSREFQSPADQPEVLKPAARAPGQPPAGISIWQKTPGQLTGMPVVTGESRRIGEVAKIVRSRATGEVAAVVEMGGVLGIGSRQAVVPLSRLTLRRDDRLVYATERPGELPQRHPYDSARYEALAGHQSLAALRDEQPDRAKFSAYEKQAAQRGAGD